ncbi:MAG: alpha-L-fucosidase [Ruminococcaceae bacterium]|nr:alpha-L-fucosidase [Oscillospiraceae bacterium]
MQDYPIAKPYIQNFEQMAFGMFVHLGLFSQLGAGEWTYTIHKRNMAEYETLIDTFKVDNLQDIVMTAKSAGCRYLCLTTRHHEGFSLYDTKGLSDFDIIHSPTGRDILAEFVELCRAEDITPFFYHTTLDWHHKDFGDNFEAYLDYLYKSIELLCTNYGKIGGFWFDGNWSKPNEDWKEDRLYKMIHRLQPEAIIINNTGLSNRGALGAEEIDAVTYERGMPSPIDRKGHKKYVAGEMCETLCDHWGAANDINFKPVKQLIEELCECRKVGANFLLNIGPNADGSVPTMQKGIMECIGKWMNVFGRAIYNGRPYRTYAGRREFLLRDAKSPKTAYLFAFDLKQSSGNKNVSLDSDSNTFLPLLEIDKEVESICWMDNDEKLDFRQQGDELILAPEGFAYGTNLCVRVAEITFK